MKRILTLIVCAVSLNAVGQVPNYLPYNPDFDGDSWIGINDLLNVLSVYAAEWENGELLVSSDSTAAMLYLGEKEIHWCYHDCINLNGPWQVAQKKDFMRHMPMLEEFYGKPMVLPFDQRNDRDAVWMTSGEENLNVFSLHGHYSEDASLIQKDILNTDVKIGGESYTQSQAANVPNDCWCAISEQPHIEYAVCDESEPGGFHQCVSQKQQQGWYPLGSIEFDDAIGHLQAWWRWAD